MVAQTFDSIGKRVLLSSLVLLRGLERLTDLPLLFQLSQQLAYPGYDGLPLLLSKARCKSSAVTLHLKLASSTCSCNRATYVCAR